MHRFYVWPLAFAEPMCASLSASCSGESMFSGAAANRNGQSCLEGLKYLHRLSTQHFRKSALGHCSDNVFPL